MKLFSQIQSNQNRRSGSNNELFSFHQHYHPQQSNTNQPSKAKTKNNFKLQPQLYFQRKNEEQQRLYQTNNHISVLSEQQHRLNQQERTRKSRKRIFNNDPRLTYLKEHTAEDKLQTNQISVIAQKPKNQEQSPIQLTEPQNKILPQQTKENNVQPKYTYKLVNSSYEARDHRRKISKFSFNHQESNRFLINPILQQTKIYEQSPNKINHNLNIQTISRNYSQLMKRMDDNDQHLIQIQQKLNKKIVEDERKHQYLMKLLAQKDRKSRQKDIEIESLRNRCVDKQKTRNQIEQNTRLQFLMLQNKHLTLKIQKQQQRLSQQKDEEELHKINSRIQQLKKMRELQMKMNRNQSNNSFNLEIPKVQYHYLGDRVLEKPIAKILPPQRKDNTLQNSKNVVFRYSYLPQNHMIPQRDVSTNKSEIKLKQMYVPITRIY